MKLRPYQREAVDATWQWLRDNPGQHPVVVIPTGGGKTALLATMAREAAERWDARSLIVSHVSELLQQAEGAISQWWPGAEVGVHSAGLKRRDTDEPVLVGGIQSIYQRAYDIGRRELVIVDEAHLISPRDGTRYREFLADLLKVNPTMRVVGLTATPYRTESGRIYGRRAMFAGVSYSAELADLIGDGYLSPLVTKRAEASSDASRVRVQRGDYVVSDLAELLDRDAVVEPACRELLSVANGRRSVLVFGVTVAHCERIVETLRRLGEPAELITGETPELFRQQWVDDFRSGRLRTLVNCQVLTTGFDAPGVDCVAVMRPTCSPGLFAQMVGRGLRLAPGKDDCLVLDFGGNIERHGCLDSPDYGVSSSREGSGGGDAPTKTCPSCDEEMPLSATECDCGFIFPSSMMPRHEATASDADLLQGEPPEPVWHDIEEVRYFPHQKKGADEWAPKTLRVEYYVRKSDMRPIAREWVCVEHDPLHFAYERAGVWWAARSEWPMPDEAAEAARLGEAGALAPPLRIATVPDGKYTRVADYELGEVPAVESVTLPVAGDLDPGQAEWYCSDEEIPW